MLATALVLLSENDPEAPALPGVATVSKEDDWDDGCFDIGAEAASRGVVWVDRPYFVGNPEVGWFVERANRVTGAGGLCQIGNEQNLALEAWAGGPEAWFAFEDQVRSLVSRPDRMLAMPPSPGVPGWQEWVRPAGDHAVHAYGSNAGMQDTVRWYLEHTEGDVYVTEHNFGAGNAVDVSAWAYAELDPFLAWCASQPRIRTAAYFSWKWDQSPSLPSSVDAADCPAVVEVLTKYATAPEPPDPEEPTMPDIVLSVPTRTVMANPANYDAGPRASTRGVVVHTTRGNSPNAHTDYAATVAWFRNPAAQVSAHLVVGPTTVTRCLRDSDVGWHARSANASFLGIEIAQPTITSPIGDFQYEAAAEACRLWAQKYGFPLTRSMSINTAGLLGHQDSEPGKQDGKTDPGVPPSGVFDWSRFLALCTQSTPTGAFDVDAVRDQLWALATSCEEGGHPWLGQGVKSAVALSKGDA